jgi:hypothetical protein
MGVSPAVGQTRIAHQPEGIAFQYGLAGKMGQEVKMAMGYDATAHLSKDRQTAG